MRRFLSRLLTLVSCWVGLISGLALQATSQPVSNALLAAKAALEDGFTDLALKQARQVIDQPERTPDQAGEAWVVVARALLAQERYAQVAALLDDDGVVRGIPPAWGGGLLFWRAMAWHEQGDETRALLDLDRFDARYGGTSYASRAARLRAWCYLRSGRRAEAFAMFSRLDRELGNTPEGWNNLLDWGRALMDAGELAPARQQFEGLISRAPDSDAGQDARLHLAQVLIREKKAEKAWNVLDILANDKGVRSDRRALAWYGLSELNATGTNLEAALAAVLRGMDLAPGRALKMRGTVARGRLLFRMGKIEEGAALVKSAIVAEPDSPASGRLQLELARSYYDAGLYDKSAEECQYHLETFTNRAGQAEASGGKGAALFKAGRYSEAAAAFEKAAGLFYEPDAKMRALYRVGDAWFAKEVYPRAAEAYRRVHTEFPRSDLAGQALLQDAECHLRVGERLVGEQGLRAVMERFAGQMTAGRAELRLAESLEDGNQVDEALAGYSRVAQGGVTNLLVAEAVHRRGLLLYRVFRFEEALRDFERVVGTFSTSSFVEQAGFMCGWCLYMMNRDEEALAVCMAFVEQYPNSEWTPGVLFWLGEYQYNAGFFEEGEKQFKRLVGKYPKDVLADDALLWAGRSASKQKQYLRAIEHFSRLAKGYPDSSNLAEARFFQGDAMSELGDLSSAIVIFQEIITRYPTNYLVSAAWGRKGDCQFTLGAEDSKRYDEARESYRAVLTTGLASPDLVLQAEYKIGRCLEKLALTDEALEQYYTKVVCRYMDDQSRSTQPNVASAVWFTRAAFAAADILESRSNWKRAVRVLQRVVDAGVPASHDAREHINKIRAEHWGLFY